MDELMNNAVVAPVIALNNESLKDIPGAVVVPRYDRSQITPGIVHIGLGNFHRAHQSWYLHQLMQTGEAKDWGIIGAGVRPNDAQTREKLLAQDCLTTLVELDPTGRAVEIVGSMIDFVPVEEHNGALISAMSDAAIRIVSLTVTEGGYYVDADTGGLDTAHPDIQHDAQHPDTPITAFGAIVAALKHRRDNSVASFTGQSCDNLQGNGDILKQTVVGLAKLSDPALAQWIEANTTFPNSMVDCIVPATGVAELALVQALGIGDAAPVTHENFRQWVLEDNFCAGRPDWDKAGATFETNIHDYETMKLRILNAGHQVLANAGELLSVNTISECMTHPVISALFHKVEMEEIVPYVDAVPGMTPENYVELISQRFSNPEIVDTTRRVAFDGSARHAGFVLPILRDALDAGGSIEGLALVEALWARMCTGIREDGREIEPNDPFWDDIVKVANEARDNPQVWLDQKSVYAELGSDERFSEAFDRWLRLIFTDGVTAAINTYAR